MDFEKMQAIWDSQGARPEADPKLSDLVDRVQKRSGRLGWGVRVQDLGMLAICLGLAVHEAWEPLVEGTDRFQLIGAGLFLGVAVYVWVGGLRRRRRERACAPTVLGELERAICRVDYQIWRSRTFLWWFLLPAALLILVSLSQTYDSKPVWKWLVAFASFPLSYAVVQLGLRCILREKRELEALRTELSADA